jgi:hypothetical protein
MRLKPATSGFTCSTLELDAMKLTIFDTVGNILTTTDVFVNADGWHEDVTRSATFYAESEIALGNLDEGGLYWGVLTDLDDAAEAYFVFED